MASRHLSRSIVMQSLYEWDFYNKEGDLKDILERNIDEFGPGLNDENKLFAFNLVEGISKNLKRIDELIAKCAPAWPLEQIAVVDRNVLRIGIFELLWGDYKQAPPKVVINEAIELAKSFGGDSSGKFVNGVLGTIYRLIGEPGKDDGEGKKLKEERAVNEGGVIDNNL